MTYPSWRGDFLRKALQRKDELEYLGAYTVHGFSFCRKYLNYFIKNIQDDINNRTYAA